MRRIVKILASAVLATTFFLAFHPYLSLLDVHGDERYYIGSAMQNLQFLSGGISANQVHFEKAGNHPFTAQLFIGLAMALLGEDFTPPLNPWQTNPTTSQVVAARSMSLIVASIVLASLILFAFDFHPAISVTGILYLLSSPGFIQFSLTAFLDIFVTAFVLLSLLMLYWYVTKRSRRSLFLSALFLGLAFGSKTSWDPIVALVIVLLAIPLSEPTIGASLGSVAKYILVGALSFGITSPIIVLRWREHIQAVQPFSAYIGASNPLVSQAFVSAVPKYNIFGPQQDINLVIYAIFTIGSLAVLTTSIRGGQPGPSLLFSRIASYLRDDRLALYAFLIILFAFANLFVTSFTFEYGRNYGRHTVYQALALVVSQAYVYRKLRKKNPVPGLIAVVLPGIIGLYACLRYYWTFLKELHAGLVLEELQFVPFLPQYIGLVLLVETLLFVVLGLGILIAVPILGYWQERTEPRRDTL